MCVCVATQIKRDLPSLAFRYTVFATMFSNSINSSLGEFGRPNRVGEETLSVGDVGGGRGGGREVDRGEYVRLSHGVDGTPIRAPICVPADANGIHGRSPFPQDQRAWIHVSSRCISIRYHRAQGSLDAASDDSPYDRSTGRTHLESI